MAANSDDVRVVTVITPSRPHVADTDKNGQLEEKAESKLAMTADNDDSDKRATTDEKVYSKSRRTIRYFVLVVKPLVCLLVLATLVASKISITTMLAHLHSMTPFGNQPASNATHDQQNQKLKTAIRLYWQLLLILAVPNIITWVRSLFNGIVGKSATQPRPKLASILGGILVTAVEAVSETALLFCGWILPPPEISLFLMNGMFLVPGIIYLVHELFKCHATFSSHARARAHMHTPQSDDEQGRLIDQPESNTEPSGTNTQHKHQQLRQRIFRTVIALVQVIGLLFQFVGIVLACVFVGLDVMKSAPIISWIVLAGAAVCTVLLSVVWTDKVQKLLFIPNLATLSPQYKESAEINNYKPIARWKASFIGATVRLLLYPFASYLIFRYTYRLNLEAEQNYVAVDPWCLKNGISIGETLTQWELQEMAVFIIHITCSFLAYSFSWLACFTTLHKYGLALPVLLATPASLVVYVSMTYLEADVGFKMDKIFDFPVGDTNAHLWLILAFFFATFLWMGQCMINTYRLWTTKNAILASDKDMFVRPYYSSILLEQYLILNRPRPDLENKNKETKTNDSKVFICSTMFRENATEMKQLLLSLRRVAVFYKKARNDTSDSRNGTKFESHIFLDNGCNGTEILQFGVQLLSLIPDTLGVDTFKHAERYETPYGCCFKWTIEKDKPKDETDKTGMPFTVHFKDNRKVKNKKRWSQVMYMNYVIDYRRKKETLDLSNTFILTTDADIDFKAKSAVVLLDMLARDPHVGAVSARTHPKGSGLVYWYQVFDYAVGHWLQKPAEHILGCVLCCPGCFSIFRCSALKQCLEKYSEEVTSAFDFLIKDMGEDRWLCTLLVENSWRLEYCAISNDETFCPVDFDEFFKQRRRWIPSTIANLWLLVKLSRKITRKNKSINFLFILYQILIILSTVIAPATVILIISACLAEIHDINQIALISSLLAVSVLYGLACLFTNQRTQLDFAKLLTLFFAILMVAVVVGLLKGVVDDIQSLFVNKTMDNVFRLPVDASTFYSGFFALIFPITAILHYREWWCLIQSIWYLLGLPGGYLVLLIYSAANLNSRSWGTREEKSDNDNENIIIVLYKNLKMRLSACCQKRAQTNQSNNTDNHEDKPKDEDSCAKKQDTDDHVLEHAALTDEPVADENWQLTKWLSENHCSHFHENFVKEGYTDKQYVSGMTRTELKQVGVEPEGLVRRLEKSAKRVVGSPINPEKPDSVKEWLAGIKMLEEDYVSKFEKAGYKTSDDVEHLKEITEEELEKEIGVKKLGHRKRLVQAIKVLRVGSKDERQKQNTETMLNKLPKMEKLESESKECVFWEKIIKATLHPVPESLITTRTNELKNKLNNLRYTALIGIFLINLVWIVLFLTLTFEELQLLNINPRVLIIVFLGIYGVILLIQFVTMVIHRFVTLAHYIARLDKNRSEPAVQSSEYQPAPNSLEPASQTDQA